MENIGLQVFTNGEFGDIRIVQDDDRLLFCGSDVAKALGYARPNEAVAKHCRGTLKRRTPTTSGIQEMLFISEGDVYRLIVHSRLPSAERFERWVFDEVLPCIRNTGAYMTPETIEKALLSPDTIINLATQIKNLQEKIKNDAPMVMLGSAVESSDSSISVGDMAKILRQNGIKTGQNRLFEWLRLNGYLIKDGDSRNMPTQKSMELGIMEIQEKTIGDCSDEFSMIARTPKITGKGQSYFVNKFLASGAAV